MTRRGRGPVALMRARWVCGVLLLCAAMRANAPDVAPGRPVSGVVLDAARHPVAGVSVSVRGASIVARTDAQGRYTLAIVPDGELRIEFRKVGFGLQSIVVPDSARGTVQTTTLAAVGLLGAVVVTAPTRALERIVAAPAAVSVVDSTAVAALAATGQAPRVLESVPGVDVVHSGFNDFNINARGLNNTLNRRILVLQDGRDLSLAFNAAQEWIALSLPLDDFKRIEMVRGPGSALYGANAYNGVLTFTSPAVRDVPGTRMRVSGGGLGLVRGDVRHAASLGRGRWAYKVSLAGSRSDTWTRSRTEREDLAREYEKTGVDATELSVPPPGYESAALAGQTKQGAPGAPGPVTGDRDPIVAVSGTARLDRYFQSGALFTAEAGLAHVENETAVSALGRLQVGAAARPWARLAYDTPRSNMLLYYSGRRSSDQLFLASGSNVDEASGILHLEGQRNRRFWGDRALVVAGASARMASTQSHESLLARDEEGRRDYSGAVFGQLEAAVKPALKFVVSARGDGSTLHTLQFSPRAALVWSPTSTQSVRLSVGHAFQTPNVLEYFVNVPAGADVNFSQLEAGLRASPLGGTLQNVPQGTLFTNSFAVPIRALGNPDLDVEHVTSFEAGYKAEIGGRAFVTLDAYYSRLRDFVSDLLPGANPAYGPWRPPPEVPALAAPIVAAAVRGALIAAGQPLAAAGLSRLNDGRTAIIISLGNAGRADGYGVEVGTGVRLSQTARLDGAYAFSRTDIDQESLISGDIMLANTPRHKGNVAMSWTPSGRLAVRVSETLVARYEWASGLFAGDVPSRQSTDASVAFTVRPGMQLHAYGSNLFDQPTYQLVGGSVSRTPM